MRQRSDQDRNLVVMHENYTENVRFVAEYCDSKGKGGSVLLWHISTGLRGIIQKTTKQTFPAAKHHCHIPSHHTTCTVILDCTLPPTELTAYPLCIYS